MSISQKSRVPTKLIAIALLVALVAVIAVAAIAGGLFSVDNRATLQLDPSETGTATIAVPPSDNEILVRFDGRRAALAEDFAESHSVASLDDQVTVTLDDCGFPRGCVLRLDLTDVAPDKASQAVDLLYLISGSEYLDDIVIEYQAD